LKVQALELKINEYRRLYAFYLIR